MSHSPAAVLILALVGFPVAAAPALKGKAAFYYPTKEGDKCVYEARTGTSTTEYTETVTKVETKDGKLVVSVGRELKDEVIPISKVEVSEKGLFRVASGNQDLAIPTPLLKLPAKAGDSWTNEPAVPDGAVKRTVKYTVGKEEEVEVPAGKFKAVQVEVEQIIEGRERTLVTTYWYAAGVGVVKSTMNAGGKERTVVLKSFTPGK
jgi:hypothetical protein